VLRHAQSILIESSTDVHSLEWGFHISLVRYMRHEVMKYAWILHLVCWYVYSAYFAVYV
jgi:hypothetical protein